MVDGAHSHCVISEQQILLLYKGKSLSKFVWLIVNRPPPNPQRLFNGKDVLATCYTLIGHACSLHRLQLVARESQKTQNVDLEKLISTAERCSVIVSSLLEVEISSIRMVNRRLCPTTFGQTCCAV